MLKIHQTTMALLISQPYTCSENMGSTKYRKMSMSILSYIWTWLQDYGRPWYLQRLWHSPGVKNNGYIWSPSSIVQITMTAEKTITVISPHSPICQSQRPRLKGVDVKCPQQPLSTCRTFRLLTHYIYNLCEVLKNFLTLPHVLAAPLLSMIGLQCLSKTCVHFFLYLYKILLYLMCIESWHTWMLSQG